MRLGALGGLRASSWGGGSGRGLHASAPPRTNPPPTHPPPTQRLVVVENNDDLPVMKQRQRTAFPPNYIHSIDSSHMMLTAIACRAAGEAGGQAAALPPAAPRSLPACLPARPPGPLLSHPLTPAPCPLPRPGLCGGARLVLDARRQRGPDERAAARPVCAAAQPGGWVGLVSLRAPPPSRARVRSLLCTHTHPPTHPHTRTPPLPPPHARSHCWKTCWPSSSVSTRGWSCRRCLQRGTWTWLKCDQRVTSSPEPRWCVLLLIASAAFTRRCVFS